MSDNIQISALLAAWSDGDERSLDLLMPVVETELRRIAHAYMRREDSDHTLQTTALVNEVYLKLVDQNRAEWKNRAHFYGVAAQVMRRILINYARDRATQKRGGATTHICFDEAALISREKSAELVALDEALDHLKTFDLLKSRIVEMRYFGGMTIAETAEVLKIAEPTVSLHWRLARAWLQKELENK